MNQIQKQQKVKQIQMKKLYERDFQISKHHY